MTEGPAAFSVPEILGRFRDLGSSWWPSDRVFLSCDPAFNRYTRFWVKGPTLDATNGALETLLLLDRPSSQEDRLYSFLAQRFLPETGTFATNGGSLSAGIYGLQNALGVLKTLHGLKPYQALGFNRYTAALERIGQNPSQAFSRLKVFLKQCAAAAKTPGGLLDHPDMDPPIPTVTTLHTATSTLWNLCEEGFSEVLGEAVPCRGIRRFLLRCLHERTVSGVEIAAFSINPHVDELCTNTTFFALETIRHLGGEDILKPETKRKIVSFLTRIAWSREGGFRSTMGEIPSLNATFFGLRALLRLSEPTFRTFAARNLDSILKFVDSCSRKGGYAFTNRLEHYLPNSLATRYAIQIRDLLHREIDAPVLAKTSAADTVRFLQNKLWDERSGAYQGYPANSIKDADQHTHKDLYQWDPEVVKAFSVLAEALKKAWAIDSGIQARGAVSEIKIRGGRTVQRKKWSPRAPSPGPKYSLRKAQDGTFSLVEAASRSARRKTVKENT